MGSTCSIPEVGPPFLHSFNGNKSTPSESTIETIERLIACDRKGKKHGKLDSNCDVSYHKKFLIPSGAFRNEGRLVKPESNELSSKVYTFKEYKQYLQAKRESKVISTPVTSLTEKKGVNNQRCRTATIRKIGKDEKPSSVSTSTSSSPSSSSSSSSPLASSVASYSISNSSAAKLVSSPANNSKKVTWQKTGRNSSVSDKESSDDSGIGSPFVPLEPVSLKSKRRVRPTVDNLGHKTCYWPTA
ncbi:putative protein TPRXL [Tetranychus urticae]|uniref:Uncharacterized protein n=1 Tax=Tetranychus urticae TaxID=32264 RepID=T1KLR9_TETUR|nr:putative protein TPRXL [Tetranychus urticae]